MLYNVYFEAAAICYLFILNVYIRLQYSRTSKQNILFQRLAVYLLIASELICGIFDLRGKKMLLPFPAAAVVCILLTFTDGYAKYLCSGVPIILLFMVIPLIILLLNRRKKEVSR